jgi:hypothetical protein
MAFRLTEDRVNDERRWRTFVKVQAERIRAIGLGAPVTQSQAHFLDFLEHGYLDHHEDPTATSSWSFDDARLMKLVDLCAAYFNEFGGSFSPMALPHVMYHEALRERLRQPPVS